MARLRATLASQVMGWLRAGSKLAFGSDYPVENPNPFVNWAVAITRQDANGQPIQGWRPEERVTLSQAWWAFTQGAAFAGFAEEKFGTLAPGQRADFIIIDRDPTEAGAADLGGGVATTEQVADRVTQGLLLGGGGEVHGVSPNDRGEVSRGGRGCRWR